MKNCIIVGGGIIGLSSAYFLQKDGHQVTVIDQGDISEGTSFINAGYLTPSHFIPIAAPGMITQGIKYMFDPSSPFYMKPRLDKDFIKWVLLFKRSCTKKNVEKNAQPILEFNLFSQKMFRELKTFNDFDFQLEHKGLLMTFQSAKMENHETEIAEKAIEMGLKIDKLNKDQLAELEPNLIANGAFHYHSDSHTTPAKFMEAMKKHLVKNGVVFKLNEEVLDINASDKEVEIETKKGKYYFDEVVIATGSWTEKIAKKLKQYTPIQAGKGYAINSFRTTGISYPTILSEAKVAVTPMDGFTRFAGTMELAGLDNKINIKRVIAIANTAKRYYRNFEFNQQEIARASLGFRPVSPDGIPFIGRLDKFNNITIAAGYAMMGWSLGPGTGKLVSEIISEKKLSFDLNPFHPSRKL